jgi:hypothetical protein
MIKFYAWERSFMKQVFEARAAETVILKKSAFWQVRGALQLHCTGQQAGRQGAGCAGARPGGGLRRGKELGGEQRHRA